ncbi:glucose-6-phosphate isomerase [Perlucidibaca aquatica]|uniref:glucose-6-phosphate isomerase n=1 Tax=Perlucidibaca aquatica TaxID=1852776 RepID=UPI000B074B89|nr:glucose-6-phosphate isomerase [Perlucidibaca aquatica]
MTKPQINRELRHQLPSWQHLRYAEVPRWQALHLREVWGDATQAAQRVHDLTRCHDGLRLDFSKQRIDPQTLSHLLSLAEEVQLPEAIAGLMRGDRVNLTEDRAALHTALRLPKSAELVVEGEDVVAQVHSSLARVRGMVQRIHERQWRGVTGEAMTDVVCIGVGGSDLGPYLVTNALAEFAPPMAQALRIHFVSSIDGTQIADLLNTLRQDSTLLVIASKSFTTLDTLSNAETALTWMQSRLKQRERILQHHVVGISAKPEKMTAYGIPEANQIRLWDWVGGRFSLWSGIGFPIALKLGMAGFEQLLAGAHAMDEHFRTAPLADNLPVIMGLLMAWNSTFLGINGQAILPYDARLKLFPSYLTQLEMESNGKSVDRYGDPVPYDTCPILWGEVGSNAQHAFYQLLHQGTQPVACDFIAPIRRYQRADESGLALQHQHELSLANCFAQARVLMLGDDTGVAHRYYHGNQPSSTLLMDVLTPYRLGQLIALYEHKVFVASVIWDINPFDQWGVELGKQLASSTHAAMTQRQPDLSAFDASTQALLEAVRS